AGGWAWREFFQTYHLATVQPKVLYRDGFRSFREFQTAVLKVQPKTVISLLDSRESQREPYDQERDYCVRSKVKFIRISVPLGGWPSGQDIKVFVDTVSKSNRQPVLVH